MKTFQIVLTIEADSLADVEYMAHDMLQSWPDVWTENKSICLGADIKDVSNEMLRQQIRDDARY